MPVGNTFWTFYLNKKKNVDENTRQKIESLLVEIKRLNKTVKRKISQKTSFGSQRKGLSFYVTSTDLEFSQVYFSKTAIVKDFGISSKNITKYIKSGAFYHKGYFGYRFRETPCTRILRQSRAPVK
jgi:hypothetical protein